MDNHGDYKSNWVGLSNFGYFWHFEQRSSDLFKDYIHTFLKIKQDSSGFHLNAKLNQQATACTFLPLKKLKRAEGKDT
jgi:hypothetical protein